MNEYLEKFVKENIPNPGTSLDLGAGDFTDAKGLRKMGWVCEGVDIKTGVDLEKEYLSKSASFDLVYSNYLLHFLKNKKGLIKSAYNNLKDDGWFFFHDLERSGLTTDMYSTKEAMEKLITECGFKIIKSRKFKFFDDKPDHKHWHEIVEIQAKKY